MNLKSNTVHIKLQAISFIARKGMEFCNQFIVMFTAYVFYRSDVQKEIAVNIRFKLEQFTSGYILVWEKLKLIERNPDYVGFE